MKGKKKKKKKKIEFFFYPVGTVSEESTTKVDGKNDTNNNNNNNIYPSSNYGWNPFTTRWRFGGVWYEHKNLRDGKKKKKFLPNDSLFLL